MSESDVATDFRILGPMTFRSAAGYRPVTGARHRRMLAILLLNANGLVSVDRFIDAMWDTEPPATARQQVQNCVGLLTGSITKAGLAFSVVRRPPHYMLELDDDRVDALRFQRLCRQAEADAAGGAAERAVARLRAALALWQGDALEDADSALLRGVATSLRETRMRAIERLVVLEFARAGHGRILADLTSWVALYPYHEGLHVRLAQALHHCGRTADGLQALRTLRARLAEELGLQPGQDVLAQERRLLGAEADPPADAGFDGLAHSELLHSLGRTVADLSAIVHVLLGQVSVRRP
ncbi:BTAD domain-containing putative transcriptional regulator [Catellatospora coxensis]|uniref:Bacterial transcriptional activator domain-containing protein n=1 Tax=Catellatospora coxensis TaxID=310354 RepID=A0A8J3KQC1_9ACTN|nr:AfsR/SARP family transcriptional regulator [Catellatospora coxensis]GIG06668.1 hypothetical protein Cco03nite_33680 [Catellatospora coxensis]